MFPHLPPSLPAGLKPPLPYAQLPEEVRVLEQAPFNVIWKPVVVIVETSPEVPPQPLKDTLSRKELIRAVALSDLFLRLDPTTALHIELKALYEAHASTGEAFEMFS